MICMCAQFFLAILSLHASVNSVFIKYSNAAFRLARRRQSRCADVQTESRGLGRRLEATESSQIESRAEGLGGRMEAESSCSAYFRNLSVIDQEIIHEIQQFHSSLASLESVLCTTCLEQFPNININVTGLCRRCHLNTDVPKLFVGINYLATEFI